MGKKWIWGIIFFFIVSIASQMIVRYKEYDYLEGMGSVVLVVYAVLLFIIFRVFFSGYIPKTPKEAKKFQEVGAMKGLLFFVLISATLVILAVSAFFTFGNFSVKTPLVFLIILCLRFLDSLH